MQSSRRECEKGGRGSSALTKHIEHCGKARLAGTGQKAFSLDTRERTHRFTSSRISVVVDDRGASPVRHRRPILCITLVCWSSRFIVDNHRYTNAVLPPRHASSLAFQGESCGVCQGSYCYFPPGRERSGPHSFSELDSSRSETSKRKYIMRAGDWKSIAILLITFIQILISADGSVK